MFKKIAVFTGKLLFLFFLLEMALRLGGGELIDRYSFRHKAECLPERGRDLPTMVRMHQVSRPKAPGELRVVMIGNSGIRGGWVPASWALPAHLQEVLNQRTGEKKIKVYNLAFNGTRALEDFMVAKEAVKYQPDLVVWGFTLWDFTDTHLKNDYWLLSFNLRRYLSMKDWFYQHDYRELYIFGRNITQKYINSRKEKEDCFLDHYSWLWRYREAGREILLDQALYVLPSGLVQEAVNYYQGDMKLLRFEPRIQRWKKAYFFANSPVYSTIRATRDLLYEEGIPLIVFLQPLYPNYGLYPPEFDEDFRQLVQREAAAQKLNYTDFSKLLEPERQFFFDNIHLTPAGNRRLAESLSPLILKSLKLQVLQE